LDWELEQIYRYYWEAIKLGSQKVATADDADDPYVKVGAGLGWGRVYMLHHWQRL